MGQWNKEMIPKGEESEVEDITPPQTEILPVHIVPDPADTIREEMGQRKSIGDLGFFFG